MHYMMKILLALCSVIFVVSAYDIEPPIPVASVEQGVQYNPNGYPLGTVTLEAIVELNCPDSLAAWAELKQVYSYYAGRVNLIVHQLPLPYHRNGFLSTQGYYLVEDQDPANLFAYMETILNNWDTLITSATRDMTENQVIDLLATYAEASTNVAKDFFIANIDNYFGTAGYAYKYAQKRGAAGTPWYIVNGVNLEISSSLDVVFADWVVFIDSLLAGTRLSAQEWPHHHSS